MVALLLLLFILVPLAELFVIVQVGELIGVLPTLGLLALDAVLGTLLLRAQGRAAWRRLNAAIEEGRAPAREVLDGALVLFGGALLLTPGFLTDIAGVLLLLPPTRAGARVLLVRALKRRVRLQVSYPGGTARWGSGRGGPDDPIEGTARDVDRSPHTLPPPHGSSQA
jgi:UPF0716 protein FxsA